MLPEPDVVTLPVGLATPTGIVTTVRVRELNGYDEEAIARAKSLGQRLLTILDRATVKIGDEDSSTELLRELFLGDRMAVLVAISRVTWGSRVNANIRCDECGFQEVEFNLDDLEYTKADPADSEFTVALKKGVAKVRWPDGHAHEALLNLGEQDNVANYRTLLINKCVVEINDIPVFGDVARKLSVADRSTLVNRINEIYLGPRFDKTSVNCPSCGEEVSPAIGVGALFPI
jgi:hypothetical protein